LSCHRALFWYKEENNKNIQNIQQYSANIHFSWKKSRENGYLYIVKYL